MKKNWAGYTIIELMIVTAVTGAIAISAIALVSGQQRRNEFNQSVRDFESKIIDVANDVSRGYFPDTGATCQAGPTGITLGTGGEQGTNEECIFGGKVLEFTANSTQFDVETIAVRKRYRNTNTEVSSISSLSNNDLGPVPVLSDRINLLYGLQIDAIRVGATRLNSSSIGFMTSFGGQAGDSRPTGAPITDVAHISGALTRPTSYIDLPSTGYIICLEHGNGGRRARVTIGQSGRELTTTTEYDTPPC